MPEPLRPMSTGELLDRTFALYKRNFWLFAGIVVPAPALVLGIQLIALPFTTSLAMSAADPKFLMANISKFIGAFVAAAVAWYAGISITHAATVRAVSAVHLSRSITVGQSYGGLKGRWLKVIAIVLLLLLALAAAWIVLVAGAAIVTGVAVAAGSVAGIAGKIIGVLVGIAAFVGAVVLMIWIWARYQLCIQTCVIEGTRVLESFRRSAALAKGSIMRILIVFILFIVVNVAVAFTLQIPVKLAVLPLHSFRLAVVVQGLASFIAGVLVGPLATIAMSLVYYDERVRKEAFDLQLMMAALDGPQAGAASAS